MIEEMTAFLASFSEELRAALREVALANWASATSGGAEARQRQEQATKSFMQLFTRPGEWDLVRGWYQRRAAIADDLLRRQLELLYLTFAGRQNTPEQIARMAALEAELSSIYNNFRGELDGRPVSENQVVEILKITADSEVARDAWEASKQIGVVCSPKVLELVQIRNQAARAHGFENYYLEQLELQEVDAVALFALLDELEQATREPFLREKARIDAMLAVRFGVPADQIGPWHYADPFFQQVPQVDPTNLDAVYADQDLLDLALRSFDSQGLEVRDILERSDLYERPGKSQHAFCTHIDRLTDDVRVLCNLRPTTRWMDTLLHELGHAVYNKYLDPSLPWLLRRWAHINTTEAIAMLMGRQARSARWLERVRGLSGEEASLYGAAARAEDRLGMLIFMRWAMVMVHFERALYADPSRPDLADLWWQLVERFQFVPRPAGRSAPDWAAKIHIATSPVYYHNYILGELTASQLQLFLEGEIDDGTMVASPLTGSLLRERLFALGARYPWDETLRLVTGSTLSIAPFVQQYVNGLLGTDVTDERMGTDGHG